MPLCLDIITILRTFRPRHLSIVEMAASQNKANCQTSCVAISDEEEKSACASPSPSVDVDHGRRAEEKGCTVDEAYDFLRHLDSSPPEATDEIDPRLLRRKVDKHILPILWFLFFFHYLGTTATVNDPLSLVFQLTIRQTNIC